MKNSPLDLTEDADECLNEKPPATVSMVEQVDEIMDHSIEIASNKRMRSANISAWSLKFKDFELEKKVRDHVLIGGLCNSLTANSLTVRTDARGHVQIEHALLLHSVAVHSHHPVNHGADQVSALRVRVKTGKLTGFDCSNAPFILSLVAGSIVLSGSLLIVMAEEYPRLPETLQKVSTALVNHKDGRTFFICFIIIVMSVSSSISLVSSLRLPTDGGTP